MPATFGRLIPLHPYSGAENMAVDQALLESVDATGQPVLRFYTWKLPTLSLGYFQKSASRSEHAESRSLECVRRATGGGAIVHDHELTYSISIPNRESSAGPRLDLYRQTHRSIVEALFDHGVRAAPFRVFTACQNTDQGNPFLCFQRRTGEDLIVSGYKVVGSAQRKSRNAVLQHGSILLRTSQWAPQLPGIEELTSRSLPIDGFIELFVKRLASSISVNWRDDVLSHAEQSRSRTIVREKYGTDRWLRRR